MICSIMMIALALAGCGAETNDHLSSQQVQHLSQKQPNLHIGLSEHAKETARQNERVDDATAVATDKELSIALKVTNFNRLHLKSIRKDVHSKLRKEFPKYEVHVTSDNKLFSELQKLESSLKKESPPQPKDVQKKLKKINEDMKG